MVARHLNRRFEKTISSRAGVSRIFCCRNGTGARREPVRQRRDLGGRNISQDRLCPLSGSHQRASTCLMRATTFPRSRLIRTEKPRRSRARSISSRANCSATCRHFPAVLARLSYAGAHRETVAAEAGHHRGRASVPTMSISSPPPNTASRSRRSRSPIRSAPPKIRC